MPGYRDFERYWKGESSLSLFFVQESFTGYGPYSAKLLVYRLALLKMDYSAEAKGLNCDLR